MGSLNRSKQGTLLRTPATWAKYQNEPKRCAEDCFLCNPEGLEIVRKFTHWYLCENQYPYDAIADVHRMLVPIDHVQHERDLDWMILQELEEILNAIDHSGEYDCVMRNFTVGQSHKSHLHYHLLRYRRVD